jgi:hypothetical protein
MDLRAVWMFWETDKFLAPAGIRIPDVQPVALLLHFLHCDLGSPVWMLWRRQNLVVVMVAAEEEEEDSQFYT